VKFKLSRAQLRAIIVISVFALLGIGGFVYSVFVPDMRIRGLVFLGIILVAMALAIFSFVKMSKRTDGSHR
jgi:protein-S-isoprenylcysteine O-methyltransferase Ste14